MQRANGTAEGEFIVRGSWGNIIVEHATGKVLRINQNDSDVYADIVRFDPKTLVPTKTSDGKEHNETDILRVRYFFVNGSGRETRVDPLTDEEHEAARKGERHGT